MRRQPRATGAVPGVHYVWRIYAPGTTREHGSDGAETQLPMVSSEFLSAQERAKYGACAGPVCDRTLTDNPWHVDVDIPTPDGRVEREATHSVCSEVCASQWVAADATRRADAAGRRSWWRRWS